MTLKLGKLTPFPLNIRDVWPKEVQDFSPWLISKDGLALLGNALNMELELVDMEIPVGSLRADITCTNIRDRSNVLIEVQMGKSDHDHLGKLLTYTAGLEAVNVIWISQTIKKEHKVALDWLNEYTDNKFCFFGLEIELWCIDKSDPAPKLNLVSKPNTWSLTQLKAKNSTSNQHMRLEYWKSLEAFAKKKMSKLKFHSPTSEKCDFPIVPSSVTLKAHIEPKNSMIRVGIRTDSKNGRAYYELLYKQKEAIEKDLGFQLEWIPDHSIIRSKIWYSREGNIHNKTQWPEFHEWMIEHLEKMDSVFRLHLKEINPSDWVNPDTDKEE